MEDKFALENKALHKRLVINEIMSKKSTEVAYNAINMLNTITNEQVHTFGVKDNTDAIIYAIKIVTKHSYMDGVKAKVEEM